MKKIKKNETVLEKEYTSLYEDNKKRSDIVMIEKIEAELEKLNNDRIITIQKINQFEQEMLNLRTHLSMINGAIQTCTHFLSDDKKSEEEVVA
tara:strand:+ start:1550 stop:1828 length:279 start_codon:yes stop_codon:yes gene_type:complete